MAKDELAGFPTIHQDQFANDGFYANGAKWVSDSADSWIKIDLGRVVTVGRVTFGRDRNGIFNDRDPGQFTIEVATSDNVYAAGDDSGDAGEYSMVFDSTNVGFIGTIHRSQTLEASFSKVEARFIKLTVSTPVAAIDELEVFGSPIDIKPGSSANRINPKSKGVIPVAILGGGDLDVDVSTVRFGPGLAAPAHDGHIDGGDLILHFRTQETGIQAGDTEACLSAETTGGSVIKGCDEITTTGN